MTDSSNENTSGDNKRGAQSVLWFIFKLALWVLLIIGVENARAQNNRPAGLRDYIFLEWSALPILIIIVIEGLGSGVISSRAVPLGVSRGAKPFAFWIGMCIYIGCLTLDIGSLIWHYSMSPR